ERRPATERRTAWTGIDGCRDASPTPPGSAASRTPRAFPERLSAIRTYNRYTNYVSKQDCCQGSSRGIIVPWFRREGGRHLFAALHPQHVDIKMSLCDETSCRIRNARRRKCHLSTSSSAPSP